VIAASRSLFMARAYYRNRRDIPGAYDEAPARHMGTGALRRHDSSLQIVAEQTMRWLSPRPSGGGVGGVDHSCGLTSKSRGLRV
jgi:hypothetical protein